VNHNVNKILAAAVVASTAADALPDEAGTTLIHLQRHRERSEAVPTFKDGIASLQ